MTKHMQWEASRKTTELGSTTLTEIELTPEAKERLALKVPFPDYAPRDYSVMPWPDRIFFTLLGVVIGVVIGGVYLAWSAKGVP